MRVEYKVSTLEKIDKVVREARRDMKEIECIYVTDEEYTELVNHMTYQKKQCVDKEGFIKWFDFMGSVKILKEKNDE